MTSPASSPPICLFAAGPDMRHAFELAPQDIQGGWAERSEDLQAALAQAVRPGDAIVVKGSLGSRMGPLVTALRKAITTAHAERG